MFIPEGPKGAEKSPRVPKGAYECPAEMNSDFLIPVDHCLSKNAYTTQKGCSYRKGPTEPKSAQKP